MNRRKFIKGAAVAGGALSLLIIKQKGPHESKKIY